MLFCQNVFMLMISASAVLPAPSSHASGVVLSEAGGYRHLSTGCALTVGLLFHRI